MDRLSVDRIDPSARSSSFLANGQLGLVAIQDVALFVEDHVCSKRQPAQGAVAHLLDRVGVVHIGSDAQASVGALPTRHARTNATV